MIIADVTIIAGDHLSGSAVAVSAVELTVIFHGTLSCWVQKR